MTRPELEKMDVCAVFLGEPAASELRKVIAYAKKLEADESVCRSCAMLKTMTESGRITDPVLAGQAALTTRRSLERDRAIERAEKAEAQVAAVELEIKSWEEARFEKPGKEAEWSRHMMRCFREALKGREPT